MDTDSSLPLFGFIVPEISLSVLSTVLLTLAVLVAVASAVMAYAAVVSRIGRAGLRMETTKATAGTCTAALLATVLAFIAFMDISGFSSTPAIIGSLFMAIGLALVLPFAGAVVSIVRSTRPDGRSIGLRAGNLLAEAFACWLRPRRQPRPNSNGEDDVEFEITMASGEEVEAEERMYIENILEMGETTAQEVMTPRTDVVAVNINDDPATIVEMIADSRFSRFPVYDTSIDNIIGILHLRDVLEFLARREELAQLALREMLNPAQFVPASKKVDDILRELQLRKAHMSVVLDEYGGTAGILTIEDLLEEIVGEIQDEYDDESQRIHEREDGNWVVDGQLPLDELGAVLNYNFATEDVDTIGGLIADQLGHIPENREMVKVNRFTFVVLSMDRNRVARVLVENPAMITE